MTEPAPSEDTGQPPADPPADTGAAPLAEHWYKPDARPDDLEDKFWDNDRGINVGNLNKSYREVTRRFSTKTDLLREEAKQQLLSGRPEAAGDYKPEITGLPDGIDFQVDVESGFFKEATATLHRLGATQEDFATLLKAYADYSIGQLPDLEAEKAKLGDDAEGRINTAYAFVERNLPEEHRAFLNMMADTADGIQFIEWLMGEMGEPRQGGPMGGATPGAATLSRDEVNALMMTPEYFDPTARAADGNKTYLKVTEHFRRTSKR